MLPEETHSNTDRTASLMRTAHRRLNEVCRLGCCKDFCQKEKGHGPPTITTRMYRARTRTCHERPPYTCSPYGWCTITAGRRRTATSTTPRPHPDTAQHHATLAQLLAAGCVQRTARIEGCGGGSGRGVCTRGAATLWPQVAARTSQQHAAGLVWPLSQSQRHTACMGRSATAA